MTCTGMQTAPAARTPAQMTNALFQRRVSEQGHYLGQCKPCWRGSTLYWNGLCVKTEWWFNR